MVSARVQSGVIAMRRAVASAWRWPQRPGELPLYVQRNFRLKTFGLITVQLALVFGEMALVHWLFRHKLGFETAAEGGQMLFYALGALTLFVILWLHFLKDWYPVNYVLLLITTVLVGLFWGLSPITIGGQYLHFQVIGILVVAMAVSTGASALLTTEKVSPWHTIMASHLLGWAVGASADVVIVMHFGLSSLTWTIVAVVLTLFLLTGVLLLDAGSLLVKCNPDDFMRVIVAMDSALLVVSMPVFVLSCCLLHSTPVDELAGGAPEAAPQHAAEDP